jgi:hypothetical protein
MLSVSPAFVGRVKLVVSNDEVRLRSRSRSASPGSTSSTASSSLELRAKVALPPAPVLVSGSMPA